MTMVLKTKPAWTGWFNRGPVPNPVLFFEKTEKIKKGQKSEIAGSTTKTANRSS
jgi:hypothetical protein